MVVVCHQGLLSLLEKWIALVFPSIILCSSVHTTTSQQ
jgi:hypothetical protein